MKIRLLLRGVILPFFLTACASSHHHKDVAHTLNTYQPGLTTWNDFANDAKVSKESPKPPPQQVRYLERQTQPVPKKIWVAQQQPWWIYEQRETSNIDKTELVVGDDKRPLALLTFTGETLADVRHLH